MWDLADFCANKRSFTRIVVNDSHAVSGGASRIIRCSRAVYRHIHMGDEEDGTKPRAKQWPRLNNTGHSRVWRAAFSFLPHQDLPLSSRPLAKSNCDIGTVICILDRLTLCLGFVAFVFLLYSCTFFTRHSKRLLRHLFLSTCTSRTALIPGPLPYLRPLTARG